MSDNLNFRLLALYSCGAGGLSLLTILQQFMNSVGSKPPIRPCDHFDMIGGTGAGAIIAIMLGRLQMTVSDCMNACTLLPSEAFKSRDLADPGGELWSGTGADRLEQAVVKILVERDFGKDALLRDLPDAPCKVFVCMSSREPAGIPRYLTSYQFSGSDTTRLTMNSVTIRQACRDAFLSPVHLGSFGQEFVRGAPRASANANANGLVEALLSQAQDVCGGKLQGKLEHLVSIGTEVPTLQPVRSNAPGFWAAFKQLFTGVYRSNLESGGCYYHFNISEHRLGDSKSEDSRGKIGTTPQAVFNWKEVNVRVNNITKIEYHRLCRSLLVPQDVPMSNNFVDRSVDTDELKESLVPPSPSQQDGRRVYTLYGPSGIGKTYLAADFARRHEATFSSTFWLDGSSDDRLKNSLAGCINRMPGCRIPETSERRASDGEPEDDNLNIVVKKVLDWLARPENTGWLLIFDNVTQDYERRSEPGESGYDIRQYFPPGDHGSVLIITKLSRVAQLGDGDSMSLKKADEELSKAIFKQWYGKELDSEKAGKDLLRLLDGHPLALALAASYLRATELNAAAYIELYETQLAKRTRSEGDVESDPPFVDSSSERCVGATWTTSFQAIESTNMNAANLLRLWAFLDDKDLWHGLLQKAAGGGKQWPRWLSEMASNEAVFLDAVNLLLRFSMIEAQGSIPNSYSIHPLAQRWMLRTCMRDESQERQFLQLAVMGVGSLAPYNGKMDYWVLHQRLLPHAERCLCWMGEICKAEWNFDNITTMYAISMLSNLYWGQGQLKEAEAMYQRVLGNYKKMVDSDSKKAAPQAGDDPPSLSSPQRNSTEPDRKPTLNTITSPCGPPKIEDKPKDAKGEDDKKTPKPGQVLTPCPAKSSGNLGKSEQKLREAKESYQRALEGYEEKFGPDHKQILDAAYNLGVEYKAQAKLPEAEAMFQRALKGFEKRLEPDPKLTLNAIYNLGFIYKGQKKLDQAQEMFKRALEGYEKVYGPDHRSTLDTAAT